MGVQISDPAMAELVDAGACQVVQEMGHPEASVSNDVRVQVPLAGPSITEATAVATSAVPGRQRRSSLQNFLHFSTGLAV